MFTRMKMKRNITAAALATSSIGSATAISATMMLEPMIATVGVRRFLLIRLNIAGRLLFLAMANATLEEEYIVAFSADIVESRPPMRMMIPPNGMNCLLPSSIASSFSEPRYAPIVIPAVGGLIAPSATIEMRK